MPGKLEIMREVQEGLDSLDVLRRANDTEWTKAIKTKLCQIGQEFGCKVGALKSEVDKDHRNYGEFLYDVTWLEYGGHGQLVDAHLVAECEWCNLIKSDEIDDDFQKLLLARAGVRLMIFNGDFECDGCKPGSRRIAERLAEGIRDFNGSRAEDTWLLAAWEKTETGEENGKGWRFSYFTIETNTAIVHSFAGE